MNWASLSGTFWGHLSFQVSDWSRILSSVTVLRRKPRVVQWIKTQPQVSCRSWPPPGKSQPYRRKECEAALSSMLEFNFLLLCLHTDQYHRVHVDPLPAIWSSRKWKDTWKLPQMKNNIYLASVMFKCIDRFNNRRFMVAKKSNLLCS